MARGYILVEGGYRMRGRAFRGITLVVTLTLLIPVLSSCVTQNNSYSYSYLDLFDTVVTVTAYTDDEAQFNQYHSFVYQILQQYHRLYDIYNSYDGINNLKTINDNAGIKAVKVDKPIIDLLTFARDNSFDNTVSITLGAVIQLWNNYRTAANEENQKPALPTEGELQAANSLTNINDLEIDINKSTVYLTKKGMSLDVGAVAKGYAAQRLWEQLQERYSEIPALIGVGGNVIAVGSKPNNKSWNVGIADPDNPKKSRLIAKLNDQTIVTSGDYQRYYTVEGRVYHHIIDPKTLYPANYCRSVTIVSKDSAMADILSTALFNIDVQSGKAVVDGIKDCYAIWILDNEVVYSEGAKEFVREYE